MPSYERKIAGMLAQQRITKQEADQLLEARRAEPLPRWWQWLINPMSRATTGSALLVGGVSTALGVALAPLRVRFDGALDVHAALHAVPWRAAIADALVSWPLPALVFWGIARTFGSKARSVDFLAAVACARPIALLIATASVLLAGEEAAARAAAGKLDPRLIVLSLLVLPLVVWMIAVLVLGFREASGLRGKRLALASTLAILAAELLSKLALVAIAR